MSGTYAKSKKTGGHEQGGSEAETSWAKFLSKHRNGRRGAGKIAERGLGEHYVGDFQPIPGLTVKKARI